ncbi:T-cell antigen CD7 [Pelecanus crispus]
MTDPEMERDIAMPSDHSAGGTQDSSAGRTNVTVYHCKDCESNVCKSSNYEDFVKIGETQSATFSDETIHLVTSETEIIMCIQQKNTFPEGIYAIVWEKAMGIGDSCGTLNSGASSENVRGNSIKICCNAQINLSVPNPPLNCNAEMSGPVIVINQIFNGGESEQSTDVISVWEGESINITCSINSSENEVGTRLTAMIQPVNVIYVSKQNTSYILPALAKRIQYSKEGRDLRITLHNVQESDSNIYVCTTFIKNKDHHKKLNGKTTIVVVKAKNSGIVEQSPLYVNPRQGQSINITCALKSSHEDEGIFLLKTHMQPERVLYVSSQNASTIFPTFANRLEYSKQGKKIVITLHNIQKTDSDIYVCAGVLKNTSFLSVNRSGTMILIKEVEQTDCSNSSWVIYGLIIMVALLFFALICCTLYIVNIKKYFWKRKPNAVYEDMSYSSRRNTLIRNNIYTTGN